MKQRILFVTNHFRFSNGVASVLRSLIANLDEEKYDISLLAMYDFNEEFALPIKDKIKIIPGFRGYFRGFDKIVNLIPPSWLYKIFVKDKYDLEIAFQFGVPTKMIAESANPHRLCWMHGYDTEMLLKKYYQKFPKVINVSQYGRDRLIDDGFSRSVSDYCYNIIDEKDIFNKMEEKAPISKSHKYCIVTVGRLSPEKGFLRYLEVIKEVLCYYRDVEFWIIGAGAEEDTLKSYISDNELSGNVKMLGQQNNPYMYMKSADLYFCSSFREGFSTTCQEAAIMGIPVVSVEVSGAEELVHLAGCGQVIENNVGAMVNGLTSILQNDELISEWKKIAAENKSTFYKAERIKKATRIIDEAINNGI